MNKSVSKAHRFYHCIRGAFLEQDCYWCHGYWESIGCTSGYGVLGMIASGNGAFEIPLEGLIIMISEEDQHPHDLHAI